MRTGFPVVILVLVAVMFGMRELRSRSGLSTLRKNNNIPSVNIVEKVAEPVTAPAAAQELTATPTSDATEATTEPPSPPQAPLTNVAPKLETLRREVERNPHQAPVALVHFAGMMGRRLAEAEKSETAAEKFMTELETCVHDGAQAQSVRSLCLANAKRIGSKFASLIDRATALAQ